MYTTSLVWNKTLKKKLENMNTSSLNEGTPLHTYHIKNSIYYFYNDLCTQFHHHLSLPSFNHSSLEMN